MFAGNDLDVAWFEANQAISDFFPDADVGGAINPGDRQALYYLVRRAVPLWVLEIGTHLGASTIHIAMALKANQGLERSPHLVTIDMEDVNGKDAGPWAGFGLPDSPMGMLDRLYCGEIVEFAVSRSLDYLAENTATFDFIFPAYP